MEKQNLFPKDFCKQNGSESVLDTLYWSYFDRHPIILHSAFCILH